LRDQRRSGVALAVTLVKALVDDDAVLVENENPWIRQVHVPGIGLDAVDGMIFLHVLIDEAELSDHAAAFIG